MPVDPQRDLAQQQERMKWSLVAAGESEERADERVARFLAAHRDALAAGEGLDFEGAELAASGTVDGDEEWWAVYTTDLNAQHRAIVGALRAKLAAAEARVQELEGALKPFADLAGSGEGFCSPVTVGERSWCNNHRATYDDVAAGCDVVKANRILGGTP